MKKIVPYLYCIFLISLVSSCSKEDDSTITEEIVNETTITDEILKLINIHRQNNGLSVLEKNQTAEQLSLDHTKYMITISQINHDNFNQRGDVLKDKENAIGIAENVAKFYPDAQSVVDGWLSSSGHKENIEGNYSFTGIAAIKDDQGRYYYTQIFYR